MFFLIFDPAFSLNRFPPPLSHGQKGEKRRRGYWESWEWEWDCIIPRGGKWEKGEKKEKKEKNEEQREDSREIFKDNHYFFVVRVKRVMGRVRVMKRVMWGEKRRGEIKEGGERKKEEK